MTSAPPPPCPPSWFAYATDFGLTRGRTLLLLLFGVSSTLTEALGVGLFLPIFQFIRAGQDISRLTGESRLWELLVQVFDLLHLRVSLPSLLAAAFLCFLLRQAFVYARLVCQTRTQQFLIRRLINRLFGTYLAADAAYHDRVPMGDIVNQVTVETNRAIVGLLAPVIWTTQALVAVTYLGALTAMSPSMTVAAIMVFGLAIVLVRRWVKRIQTIGRAVTHSNAALAAFLVERVRSPRLVRLSRTETAERREMEQLTDRQAHNNTAAMVLQARTEVALEPIAVGLSCVFLYLAVTSFGMQLEEIGLYMVISMRLAPVGKALVAQRQMVLMGMSAIEAVKARLDDMTAAREIDHGTHQFAGLKRELRFEDVRFTYPGADRPALQGVNLALPAGSMVALAGPSGSGKSTLIDLLPRLRRPDAGRLLFDGEPVQDFTLDSLRRQIAYAPQNPQIFNVSVADHIRYGNPAASDAEVKEAARLAGADEFIARLPDGYDSLLGEGGNRLSGGQRQRLDLARVLLGRASILILDEPTSSLDAESEELFRQSLNRLHRETDLTILVVGHRLSTIVGADRIVILDHGVVAAVGSHAELMAQGGWYAEAVATSAGGGRDRAAKSGA